MLLYTGYLSETLSIQVFLKDLNGIVLIFAEATGQEAMHNYFGPFPDGFVYAKDIDEIDSLLDEHTCAVMIELIQGEGGVELLDRDAVQQLAQTLKEELQAAQEKQQIINQQPPIVQQPVGEQ